MKKFFKFMLASLSLSIIFGSVYCFIKSKIKNRTIDTSENTFENEESNYNEGLNLDLLNKYY